MVDQAKEYLIVSSKLRKTHFKDKILINKYNK